MKPTLSIVPALSDRDSVGVGKCLRKQVNAAQAEPRAPRKNGS
jgi:hypothetical protein